MLYVGWCPWAPCTPRPKHAHAALTRGAATNCQHLPVQDVILMSDSCDLCGYKNSELKGGGGVSDYGRRITLHVSEPDDLQRDVIKAETASVRP